MAATKLFVTLAICYLFGIFDKQPILTYCTFKYKAKTTEAILKMYPYIRIIDY